MKFREMAIQAHHKAEQEAKAWRQDQADGFAKRATKTFYKSISGLLVTATAIEPGLALLVADGIEIQAREEYDGVEFYTRATCQECDKESFVRTPTIADIGEALENGPKRCDHCEAKYATIQPGGWSDQIAEAIREAIYEARS